MGKPIAISLFRSLALCLYCLVASSQTATAQTFKFGTSEASVKHTGGQIASHGFEDTIVVRCPQWDFIQTHPGSWGDSIKLKSNHAFIRFYVDHFDTLTDYSPASYTYLLSYHIDGYPVDT